MNRLLRISAGFAIGSLSVLLLWGAGYSSAAPAKAVSHNGPFGIDLGEPLADLGPIESIGNGYYKVLEPREMNPRIATVWVTAYPSTGVCRIIAETDINADDPSAAMAKEAVDAFASALSTKYGPPSKKDDHCDDGDGQCATALARKIRESAGNYMYAWKFENARPDHIGMLSAGVTVRSLDRTAAAIGYFSDNNEACDKAAAAGSASGF